MTENHYLKTLLFLTATGVIMFYEILMLAENYHEVCDKAAVVLGLGRRVEAPERLHFYLLRSVSLYTETCLAKEEIASLVATTYVSSGGRGGCCFSIVNAEHVFSC